MLHIPSPRVPESHLQAVARTAFIGLVIPPDVVDEWLVRLADYQAMNPQSADR
jgi:hypothetical protein